MKINRILLILLIVGSLVRCHVDKAESVINSAIIYSGGDLFNTNKVVFDFRGKQILIDENNGAFTYQRTFTDTSGNHTQILDYKGFTYLINNNPAMIDEKKKSSIIESINSQVYFTMLPFKLKDPAVMKEYIALEKINERDYHKIKITFRQEGGGVDYEDQFLYWFDTEDYSMDYLAYLFHVNGGGLRFREAYNQHRKEGIVFQDYHNYKPQGTTSLDSLSMLFQEDKLVKLSEINLENIEVSSH